MKRKIYGVDTSKDITPIMVRDAIVRCFKHAHKEVLDMMAEYDTAPKEELEEMKSLEIGYLVRSAFSSAGGDFDNPTKKNLVKAVGELARLASRFRQPEIIRKHKAEIMELIRLLD